MHENVFFIAKIFYQNFSIIPPDVKGYVRHCLFICEKIIAFSARKRIYAYNTTLLILCHLIIYNIISFKLVSGESIEYGLIRFDLLDS